MGACNAKDKPTGQGDPAHPRPGQTDNNGKHINMKAEDLIQEKYGDIFKDYNLMNKALGKGAFGEVKKGVHLKTGTIRAVKSILKDSQSISDQKNLENEVAILKSLDHPNIVKIYEFYQDQKNFYIVTEFCGGGELFDRITASKKFSEKQACDVIKSVLQAINYCHSKSIVHRDLKPENLLYDTTKEDATIKIIDFGTSKVYDPTKKLTQRLGTPYYIAPEVLKSQYDNKCDIWSIGVILYILLCGYPPFNGNTDKEIMKKVEKGEFSFNAPDWSKVSDDAKDLIKNMLNLKADQRFSAEQCLNHRWIKNGQLQDIPLTQMSNYLTNMKTFRANQRLQQAIYMFIYNYFSTSEEKTELLATFKQLDTNNDGKLSQDELLEGYKKIMNPAQAKLEVTEIFRKVDFDGSGDIDYSEFVMATINRQKLLSQDRLEKAFEMFDKDGNKSISKSEIKAAFAGITKNDSQWTEMIKEVDDNGDGEISFKEFKEMMERMTK